MKLDQILFRHALLFSVKSEPHKPNLWADLPGDLARRIIAKSAAGNKHRKLRAVRQFVSRNERDCRDDRYYASKAGSAGDIRKRTNQIRGEEALPVYVIADVKVTDDKWMPEYAAKVHDIIHKHGGKYLSRSANVKTLEGKPLDTTIIALVEFPSAQAAEAFATDPDYAPFAAARQAGSESRLQLIDDTDAAGTIPYLPKG